MKKKMMKAPENECVFDGVCGGIARHYEVDPVYVRAAFFGLFLCGGSAVLLYGFLMFAMPEYSEE